MKIRIPPYPNFGITNQAFERDVVSKSINKKDSQGLSNQLVMILEFKTGKKRVLKARPVTYENKFLVAPFPNPVHLFLSVAIEHYNNSENVKQTDFLKYSKKFGNNIYLLEVEENETHDCYNHYIKYRASSIIMLVSALEAYLNHIIPNDFIYKTSRENKPIEFNKEDIESPKISFKEKLTQVIPQWLNNLNFWTNYNDGLKTLLALYENRKNIIHLKTNSEDDLERYFNQIDKMLDLDISTSINTSIQFMNLTSKDFIKIDSIKSKKSNMTGVKLFELIRKLLSDIGFPL